MGIYGNIGNVTRSQFTFDRTYRNRKAMEMAMGSDGVFIGRYVLVEYDSDYTNETYKRGYKKTKEDTEIVLYSSATFEAKTIIKWTEHISINASIIYGISSGTIVYVINDDGNYDYYICTGKDDSGNALFDLVEGLGSTEGTISNYVFNYQEDLAYAQVKGYETRHGWDSTVWQKVYSNGKERYTLIAELNTQLPTFDVSIDAPTDIPLVPHFDEQSTDIYYQLHLQPGWGLRLASADKISGDTINYSGEFNSKEQTIYSPGTTSKKSDLYGAMPQSIYNRDTGESDTYYYDIDDGTWSKEQYKYVDVTNSVFNESGFYEKGKYYYLYDDRYVIDNNSKPLASRKYYKRVERGINKAIYYNKAGFDKEKISHSSLTDSIDIFSSGKSGLVYNSHDSYHSLTPQVDTKELSIYLPSLGNAISDIWDIAYGGENVAIEKDGEKFRNLSLNWEDGGLGQDRPGLRLVQNEGSNDYTYSTDCVDTLAGCINSVHDLMGMIIVDNDTQSASYTSSEGLDMDYIYYFDKDKNYYRKALEYVYSPIEYKYIPIELTEDSYLPNMYYTSDDGSTIADSETFDDSLTYYVKMVPEDFEEYSVVEFNDYVTGQYYQTINGDYLYETAELPQKDKIYYSCNEEAISEIKLTASYESDKYYYLSPNDNYILDTSDTVTAGRDYYSIDPNSNTDVTIYLKNRNDYNKETGQYLADDGVYKSLTYLYAPGVFTNNSIFYSLIKKDGKVTGYTPLTGEIDANTDYYLVDLVQAFNSEDVSYVIDPETGAITIVSGATDFWNVEAIYKVTFIPWEENKYYYIDDNGNYILVTKDVLAEQLPKMAYRTIKVTNESGQSVTSVQKPEFVEYYTIQPVLQGTFYVPNKYYYQNISKDWILSRTAAMVEDRTYYTLDPAEVFTKLPNTYYHANTYYYDDNGVKTLDANDTATKGRTYYERNVLCVTEDPHNLFNQGFEWNLDAYIPASVSLGLRQGVYGFKKLDEFARKLNTIHGLVLKINQILEIGDKDTRDRSTIAGTLNTLNDIIAKFNQLAPNSLIMVDSYGRLNSGSITTDGYLNATVSGSFKNPVIKLEHSVSGVTGNKTIENDKTSLLAGQSFSIPVLEYDEAGHITSTSSQSLTLPKASFGVRRDTAASPATVVTELEYSASSNSIITYSANLGELPLTGYSRKLDASAIEATDTLYDALSKLEQQIETQLDYQSDWDETDASSPSYIANKPDIIDQDTEFAFGDKTMTLQALFNYVQTLEDRIAVLEKTTDKEVTI